MYVSMVMFSFRNGYTELVLVSVDVIMSGLTIWSHYAQVTAVYKKYGFLCGDIFAR